MTTATHLFKLLEDINLSRPSNFSGIGLLLYKKNSSQLPITSLNSQPFDIKLPIVHYDKILNTLLQVSITTSRYHDGFHLINEDFELTHISQFVSPPIKSPLNIKLFRGGSRYATSIYSSLLKNVIATGVLSLNYGPYVFVDGKSII